MLQTWDRRRGKVGEIKMKQIWPRFEIISKAQNGSKTQNDE